MMVSQSLINDSMSNDVCPKRIQYKYVNEIEPDNEDEENVMFKGRYFEWHLIGKTRDGIEPKFTPLKRGGDPAAKRELDELIVYAKDVLKQLGVDVENGQKQVHLIDEVGGMEGHIDLITNDFNDPSKKAIYDIKYTETKYDDRWIGWADFATKQEAQIQAAHYTILSYLINDLYMPFYFIVFGKSKWTRIISVKLTSESVERHMGLVTNTKLLNTKWKEEGYPAKPSYEKCRGCDYFNVCEHKQILPVEEIHII